MIPTDIAGLALWLKADSLSLNNDDPVGTWADSSGNGLDVTAAGAARPTFKTAILNNKPVVRFATDDVLTSTAVAVAGAAFSVFTVLKFATTAGFQTPFFNGDQPIGNGWALMLGGGAAGKRGFFFRGIAVADDGDATTSWETWTVIRTSAPSLDMYVDGSLTSLAGNTSSVITPTTQVEVGGGGGFYNGDIAELVVYDSALSTGDQQGIESYLYNKWFVAPPVAPSPSFRVPRLRPAIFKPGLAR